MMKTILQAAKQGRDHIDSAVDCQSLPWALCSLSQVTMQFLGRLLDTVSSVSTLFTNPYRVRDVPLADYGGGGKVMLKEEGRMVLYKNTQCQSWDCLLMCPEMPTVTLRLVLITLWIERFVWYVSFVALYRHWTTFKCADVSWNVHKDVFKMQTFISLWFHDLLQIWSLLSAYNK